MPGIYVHIPFCVQKCKYCDFASYPNEYSKRFDYIDALIKEMEQHKGTFADTVYVGGGTPTCLDETCLELLLKNINRIFKIDKNAEFTVEANPGTINKEKAEILKKHNVNRISMGAQSFNDSHLKMLGRIHSSADIKETFNLLRKYSFENLSLDLMYALPNQTLNDLEYSLEEAISLNPQHISCYGLKFEEGTEFGRCLKEGILKETDEDTFADMYELILNKLKKNGYVHYEISNFAKKDCESRHNLKYWNCEDYIGFGTAAASCVGLRRYTHSPFLNDYFNGYKLAEDYTMSEDEAMREFIILGLRVINMGVNKAEFEKRFSRSVDDVFSEQLMRFKDFFANDKNALKLKEEAALVSNSILCEFMN